MGDRVSRRAVLAGAVGVLAACSRSDSTRRGTMRSERAGREVRWRLAVPSVPPKGLVVALHGYGGDADSAFDAAGLGDHVERTGLAVVSVDGGGTYWHARRDGTDTGAMVAEELIPLALREAGLGSGAPVATYGWSMGGFGALHLAAALGPKRVRAAVAVSAAVWLRPGDTPEGAFDDREDYLRVSVLGRAASLRRTPVWLSCGTSDPFIEANRELARRLPDAHVVFDAGGHDDAYWRDRAGTQLDWVARQVG